MNRIEKLAIAISIVIVIGLVLLIRCTRNNVSYTVPDEIESCTKLNVDSIETITFYASTTEVFVTMLNGDEHYCTSTTASMLKNRKLGLNDTEFEVWTNSDGETEIVVSYE